MKVLIRLKSDKSYKMVKFNDVLMVDMDADNLYVYEGVCGIKLYQTIIPFKDIEAYQVERYGRELMDDLRGR